MSLALRLARPDDMPALCRIFHDAIHIGAAMHYDAVQRAAWCPARPEPAAWAERMAGQSVTVAVLEDRVAGFMTLRDDGYIDLAFVAPDSAGQGIGTRLLRAVEAEAQARGLTPLTTQASLVARPLFAGCGWSVIRAQTVTRNGITLPNFAMEKRGEGAG